MKRARVHHVDRRRGGSVAPQGRAPNNLAGMRRIGVLMNTSENDSAGQRHLTASKQGLEELGWVDGRNARVAAGKKPL